MIESLKHNLVNLLSMSGRSSGAQFWPYAILVILGGMAAGVVASVGFAGEMVARMQRFVVEHPDQVTETRGPDGSYSIQIHGFHPELLPDITGLVGMTAITAVILVALLGAAVVRRLHDTSRSGWWALPIPVLLAISLTCFPILFRTAMDSKDAGPPVAMFAALFLINISYLVNLLVLLILLVGRSAAGSNKYGVSPH